jgi:predicted site-specific integrase-resolvase
MAAVKAAPLPPPMLTHRELQEHFRVSKWTADQWVKQGIPHTPLPNGQRRYDLAEVKAWMATQVEQQPA